MAKESGIGMTVTLDDAGASARAITNDVVSLQVGTPRATQDVTGLDKAAHERLLLLADMTGSLNGIFNDAANLSHAVLKTVPAASSPTRTLAIAHSGQTLTGEVLVTDYSLNRGADGGLTWTAPFQLADGTAPAWS